MGELISLNNAINAIPDEIARDTEVTAAIAAHTNATNPHPQAQYLTQSQGDARYAKALSYLFTLDLPSMTAGTLQKYFYTVTGAAVGDICLVTPVGVNLFATAAWPFVFYGGVESANTVGIYCRNDFTGSLDLASMQFRLLILKF
ncbi:hypothetical protein [Microcoleus sp. herbarium5]|uniref:hypothetical protein n=1 Tax=Microcoleus sp. herbarium5 TaxID=3055434 RepID=UPI002FCF7141